jgi:hypothetical protein
MGLTWRFRKLLPEFIVGTLASCLLTSKRVKPRTLYMRYGTDIAVPQRVGWSLQTRSGVDPAGDRKQDRGDPGEAGL